MAVSFDHYKTFYYVGKYGSFTQAAKILGNNQPNITRTMNNLEAALGCRLLVRSRKGVALTPEGERLFEHVSSAYDQIKLGEAEIEAVAGLRSGSLSIAVSDIALHGFMLPVLQQFNIMHPGIHIRILNYSTPQGIEAVLNGTAELAVVTTPVHSRASLDVTRIRTFKEILICGRLYSSLAKKTVSLRDIISYPVITLKQGSASFEYLNKLFSDNGLDLEPAVEAASTNQIIPLVLYDIGLGFVPESFADEALNAKKLFKVNVKEELPERAIDLVSSKSRPLSAAARALKGLILQ
ncbi:MAG: LysR family transcriptional regulator [Lachnospiraceae bacterium]|nr:LysR family transcriptional regulator [Lachnospiraceae bacterium]